MSYTFQINSKKSIDEEMADVIEFFNKADSIVEGEIRVIETVTTAKTYYSFAVEFEPQARNIFWYTAGASSGNKANQALLPFPWLYLIFTFKPYGSGFILTGTSYIFSARQMEHTVTYDNVPAFVGNHGITRVCMGSGAGWPQAGKSLREVLLDVLAYYFSSTFNNNMTDYQNSDTMMWWGMQTGVYQPKKRDGYTGMIYPSISNDDVAKIYGAIGELAHGYDWTRDFSQPLLTRASVNPVSSEVEYQGINNVYKGIGDSNYDATIDIIRSQRRYHIFDLDPNLKPKNTLVPFNTAQQTYEQWVGNNVKEVAPTKKRSSTSRVGAI